VRNPRPSPDDPDVVWFGPGVHKIGKYYPLKAAATGGSAILRALTVWPISSDRQSNHEIIPKHELSNP
jgi:hypothetical protein